MIKAEQAFNQSQYQAKIFFIVCLETSDPLSPGAFFLDNKYYVALAISEDYKDLLKMS